MPDPTKTIEFHERYLRCLRMCQVSGMKLGHRMFVDGGTCVAYVLDGKVWEFCKGITLGPEDWNDSDWRLTVGRATVRATHKRVRG